MSSKTPAEILQAARQPKPREWSALFLWGSILVSVTMITGTLMWNLGKVLRTEAYLREHGVQTCVELNLPPTRSADPASEALQASCELIVTQRHERCLSDTARYSLKQLRERREDYMMCVMEHDSHHAELAR